MSKDFQTEGYGVPCTAGSDNVVVFHASRLDVLGACGLQSLFETVIAAHFHTLEPLLAEGGGKDYGRRGTNGGHAASLVIVTAKQFHKRLAGSQIGRARHSARENHHVLPGSSLLFKLLEKFLESVFREKDGLVGRGNEIVLIQTHGLHIDSAAHKHIVRGKGLDFLEAVGQKHIYSFHILMIMNQSRRPPIAIAT